MFQFPGLPSRRCGIFPNAQNTRKPINLNTFGADGGLATASPPPTTSRAPHAVGPGFPDGSRYADGGESRAPSYRVAVAQNDRRAETSFLPVDSETPAQPAVREKRSGDDVRSDDDGDFEAWSERATQPSPADGHRPYNVRARDSEDAPPEKSARAPVPYDDEVSEDAAGEDDDTALDDEIASILGDGHELQTHRNTERREYKRRRSLSRMSTRSGATRRRKPRRRRSGTDAAHRGANAGSRLRALSGATEGARENSVEPKETVRPRGRAAKAAGVLSTIVKYAKYPVYLTTHVLSAYAVLSYMGVDLTEYADLTRVSSSSLPSRVTALAEFLRRFAPTLSTSDHPAVPSTLGRS